MTTPFLQLRGVTKRFGAVTALDGVDLEVGADELLVVLGPTGAGKTTLLRTIVGLEQPDAGSLELAGTDITSLPPPARDLALVFQNFSLYPQWTVRQNLAFPLRAPGRNLGKAAIAERIQWAADLLKITPLLDRRATQLSGGEMQRVAIGRAIVRRPRLFLMDEPLTNLDAKLREALRVELACLRRGLHTPMILVTHDQLEALSMGDRIVVLAGGRVLQSGAPEDIYRRPASPAVARQLGEPPINLIPVRRVDGYWRTADGTPLLPVTGEGAETMLLGVRPEDVVLEGGPTEATVRVVEDTGPAKILLVHWAGMDVHVLTQRQAAWKHGDVVRPRVAADRVVLWPADAPGQA